jgi:hypothetical protein
MKEFLKALMIVLLFMFGLSAFQTGNIFMVILGISSIGFSIYNFLIVFKNAINEFIDNVL